MKKVIIIIVFVIVLVASLIITPNIVYAHKLDQSVRSHLGDLETSDYIENENVEATDIKYGEDLVFTVVEEKGYDNGEWYSYHIVANYDKEYSKWTIKDKEAYENAWKEFNRLSDAKNEELKQREENNMQRAIQDSAMKAKSYSPEYLFAYNGGDEVWKYNYYTKTYYFSGTPYYTYREQGISDDYSNVSISNFRNRAYPIIKQKIEQSLDISLDEEWVSKELNQLEELYHLSD